MANNRCNICNATFDNTAELTNHTNTAHRKMPDIGGEDNVTPVNPIPISPV